MWRHIFQLRSNDVIKSDTTASWTQLFIYLTWQRSITGLFNILIVFTPPGHFPAHGVFHEAARDSVVVFSTERTQLVFFSASLKPGSRSAAQLPSIEFVLFCFVLFHPSVHVFVTQFKLELFVFSHTHTSSLMQLCIPRNRAHVGQFCSTRFTTFM